MRHRCKQMELWVNACSVPKLSAREKQNDQQIEYVT